MASPQDAQEEDQGIICLEQDDKHCL
jgi:hypothetical protein